MDYTPVSHVVSTGDVPNCFMIPHGLTDFFSSDTRTETDCRKKREKRKEKGRRQRKREKVRRRRKAGETALVQDIDHLVVYANKNKEWRRGYMSFAQAQMDARLSGKEEGYAEGYAEGFAECFAESFAEGYAKGYAEGFAKGKAEGKLKMITASLKQGFMTLKQACQLSGMNEHELEQHLKGLTC